jgi:hypothetical protein
MRRVMRYVLWTCLAIPIVTCSGMCAYVIKYQPFNHEENLKKRLHTANAIPRLREIAGELIQAYPEGQIIKQVKVTPELEALGVHWMLVAQESDDAAGRYVWFEFGGGMVPMGVLIGRDASWKPRNGMTGRIHAWEDSGVYFRSD